MFHTEEIRYVFSVIIWHDNKKIVPCSAYGNINDIAFIEEYIRRTAYAGRGIKNSKDNIAFISLESVNGSDLNIDLP